MPRATVVLLAAVLGLQVADTAAIGAMATELEKAMDLGHAQLGLISSAALAVAALATLPISALADRSSRRRLLGGSIVLWSAALVACGAAPSFTALLICRVALGAVAATAWPVVVSLVGDLVDEDRRARIFGLLLSGELVGAGFGFLISGTVASVAGWRAGFWVLAPPSALLAVLILRRMPDPVRRRARGRDRETGLAAQPLRTVVRAILAIATNRLLIGASALGYFFMAGEQTFGVEFLRRQYDLGQATAATVFVVLSSGALVGVLVSGRLADRLLAKGRADARPLVAGVSFLICAAAFGTALLLPSLGLPALGLAAPAFVLAAATLEGPNAPLDAARVDVVPPGVWARAEGVRTVLRNLAQAAGPVLFGLVADLAASASGRQTGLRIAFAIMLLPLVASGLVILRSRRTYEHDRAAAGSAADRDGLAVRPSLDLGWHSACRSQPLLEGVGVRHHVPHVDLAGRLRRRAGPEPRRSAGQARQGTSCLASGRPARH